MHGLDFHRALVGAPGEDDTPIANTQPVLIAAAMQLQDVPAWRIGEESVEAVQDTVSELRREPLELLFRLTREDDSPCRSRHPSAQGAMSGFVRIDESQFDLFEGYGFAPADLITASLGKRPLLVGVGFIVPFCGGKGREQWVDVPHVR